MKERVIEDFVKHWFRGMDQMREVEYFLPYIDGTAEFIAPEGLFRGPEGFRLWYGGLKKVVKPDNKHDILRVAVSPKEERYSVEIDVLVKADTYDGEVFHVRAKEVWEVGIHKGKKISIYEYRIEEIEEIK